MLTREIGCVATKVAFLAVKLSAVRYRAADEYLKSIEKK